MAYLKADARNHLNPELTYFTTPGFHGAPHASLKDTPVYTEAKASYHSR